MNERRLLTVLADLLGLAIAYYATHPDQARTHRLWALHTGRKAALRGARLWARTGMSAELAGDRRTAHSAYTTAYRLGRLGLALEETYRNG